MQASPQPFRNPVTALCQECEEHLRAGDLESARRRLQQLRRANVPRESLRSLANIARRAGLATFALRLLATIEGPLTPQEQAEYAALLCQEGAVDEALALLASIPVSLAPEVDLFKAFCHTSRWQPKLAAQCLEAFIANVESPYLKLQAQLHLAEAEIALGHLSRALELCAQTLNSAREFGFLEIQSTCFGLQAQAHVQRGAFASALLDLTLAANIHKQVSATESTSIHKWFAIIDAMRSKNLAPIAEFCQFARRLGDWESIRECELISLQIEFTQDRFDRLLFGTPFPNYRKMMLERLGRHLPSEFYILGPKTPNTAPCLDLISGNIERGERLNPGKKNHQLLEILLRDFFRPLRVGGLFAALFPGEKFDIFSSPTRVHQTLRRTRRWLESENIPVEIREQDGGYLIEFKPGAEFSFRVPLEREDVAGLGAQWARLRAHYRDCTPFSPKAAREALGLPRSTFQRLMRWAVAEGKVERLGTHSSVLYRVRQNEQFQGLNLAPNQTLTKADQQTAA